MRGALWTHYIDNTGAQAAIVKGASSVDSATIISAELWKRVAELRIYAWLDRVESEANPVDALSRKRLKGPWKVVEEVELPASLLAELRACLY